jgi:CheY-like chemotaxis protein
MLDSTLTGPDSRRRKTHLSMATENSTKPSILVIDDETLVRQAMTLVLRNAGYEIRCAEDGRRGLEAFRERRPDLVVCDIIMPEMEGLETIMRLRVLARDCPVIAISGGGHFCKHDFLHAAKELGAKAALRKPFESAQLLRTVADCLAGRFADRRDLRDRRQRNDIAHRPFASDRRMSNRRVAQARVQ